jgi:3-oxoadipate enol-lactonase
MPIDDFNFHSGTADVNGARLYYEVAGEGYPLVLIHAEIADSRMWDVQFRTFAQDYFVVRYDMRGYGRSKIVRGDFSYYEDLAGIMDSLNIESASLIGASLGGATAIDFALAHPDRVDALVTAAASVSGHAWSNLALQKWGAIDEALEEDRKDRALELELRMWVDGPTRRPDQVDAAVREKVREMLAPTYDLPPGIAREVRLDPPAAGRLAEISAPTLALVGDSDMPDMMTIADNIEAQVKGARKVVISGAAHMINMERPRKFNQAVRQFLEDL